jgi:hypothetical protein
MFAPVHGGVARGGVIVPAILGDTTIHHSELTEIAYTYLLAQWPRKRVLSLLEPFGHSRDLEIRQFADALHDDLLEWN